MIAGTLFAALAVILGAFGAHALKGRLSTDQLQVFETGVRYHFYHSFALLVTGIMNAYLPAKKTKLATTCFITGIVLFSGSLYAMSLLSISGTSLGPIGIATPIGGLFFILGWIILSLRLFKEK
jgi:uncharacterized membrane protein YgdD (TMEM256/DUF423 family)